MYPDCRGTLQCCHDRVHACRAANIRAHLWGQIFMDDGLSGATFKKVMAHASMVDVREGRLSEFERTGNHEADRLAKQGAALSRHDPQDTLLAKGMLFKWLTPFRRPPEGVRACDHR